MKCFVSNELNQPMAFYFSEADYIVSDETKSEKKNRGNHTHELNLSLSHPWNIKEKAGPTKVHILHRTVMNIRRIAQSNTNGVRKTVQGVQTKYLNSASGKTQ